MAGGGEVQCEVAGGGEVQCEVAGGNKCRFTANMEPVTSYTCWSPLTHLSTNSETGIIRKHQAKSFQLSAGYISPQINSYLYFGKSQLTETFGPFFLRAKTGTNDHLKSIREMFFFRSC